MHVTWRWPISAETCNKQTFHRLNIIISWSQWPPGLRRTSAAARLLIMWVRIPSGGMDVCRECCVLSSKGLCDELTTRPEVSHRLWCVVVCDLETSWMRRPWPTGGFWPPPQIYIYIINILTCNGWCPCFSSIVDCYFELPQTGIRHRLLHKQTVTIKYRSLNAIVTQSRNCPFWFNTLVSSKIQQIHSTVMASSGFCFD